jgi:hypothetical protein
MAKRPDLSFLRPAATRKRIAVLTLACGLGSAGLSLLAPRWYRSTLTVAPTKAPRPGLSGLVGADLGAVAAGFDAALGGTVDAARVAAVLQSNSVSDAVIEKFGLRDRYGEKYQELARDALWGHCELKTLPKPNLVQLSCEDTDPRFVQEMLSYFAGYGNEVFRRVNAGSASEEVRFLQKRVAELRQDADATAGRMREFQETHHIVDLDTQAKAVVSTLAALNSQSITKQLELDMGRRFSTSDESGMRQLETQLRVVDQKMRDLQEPAPAVKGPRDGSAAVGRDAARGLFPAALAVPQLRADYEMLFRDRRVAETALLFAMERLEGARANEVRDTSTFQVLDPPALPTRHSRPKRSLIVLFCTGLGLAVGVGLEWWRANRGAGPLASRSSGRPADP